MVKAGANAPSKSRLQATLSECENARLRINCTIHMPAEIGPKRDCALARAGCYFDGSLTMCGAEVFALRRERCVRAIAIVARAFRGVVRCSLSFQSSTSLEYCLVLSTPSPATIRSGCARRGDELIHSFAGGAMDCFASLFAMTRRWRCNPPSSSPRMRGSSTPRLLDLITDASGVLDRPPQCASAHKADDDG